MADLVVLVPTRARPHAVAPMVAAFAATRTTAELVFVIDHDEPALDEYHAAFAALGLASPPISTDSGGAASTMSRALNMSAVRRARADDPPYAIGFMGDDHCPRTLGWDRVYVEALRELGTGMVFGNDLLQGGKLPTQIAMTSDIIRTLGYMAPPTLVHLYLDNFWRDLGTAAGCLRYLPDVVVEHRHPVAGKAKWDDGYQRVNSAAMYERDRAAYEAYQAEQFEADVAKVKALRDG